MSVGGVGGRTGSSTGSSSAGGLQGQAYFVPNQDTNAILVYVTDAKYEPKIRAIIDKLDRPVPQVVIKVLIAEVTHTNGDDIGFEFGANNLRTGTDISGQSATFGPQAGTDYGLSQATGGLKIGLVEGQVSATLRALANQNKLDLISRPYILAQDNQEAYMIIGSQVPYISNSQVTNTGDTINSVTYREVGVILDVVPHINPEGLVTLDIAPQVSQLDPGSGVPITSNVFAPTFTIRQAQSRVAVKNGETIVIGGLMQDQLSESIQKVPLLGDIPYLGMAFKRTQSTKTKTELLIFLTPNVAMTPDLLQSMTNDEEKGLKLVPNAVQPGTYEQNIEGMQRGKTEVVPEQELQIKGGSIVNPTESQ